MTEITSVEAENRVLLRDAFGAWQAGSAHITAIFAPEMTWRIEGRSVSSKDYGSRQAFIDEVLTPFGARFVDASRFGR